MIKIKKIPVFFSAILIILGYLLLNPLNTHSQSNRSIDIIQLDDATINPATAEYIINSIEKAENNNAECLILKLDTPGGLLTSTRLIVKKMLTANIPIVVYISPSGSRAGSAGVFITYASHIAAMAPSTNIGAAHPVQMGGKSTKQQNGWKELIDLIKNLKNNNNQPVEEDAIKKAQEMAENTDPMSDKILNDTVAFIKSIAKQRNRNIEWGIASVTESKSITSNEALNQNVIELIADNDMDLIHKLNGKEVNINGHIRTLNTQNATIERIPLNIRQNIFNILANPNIAYFFLILGFYGLLFEVTHPGFGMPGILGTIFLILAFYSMQTLPTNYAGVALIALGLALLIAEAFIPGFGLPTLGGVACLIFGSLFLFDSADPIMQVSKSAIFALSLSTAAITLFLVRSVIRTHRKKAHSGKEGLIGEVGKAKTDISPDKKGKVFVHGELWIAESDEKIQKDEEVVVVSVRGLKLNVTKKTD